MCLTCPNGKMAGCVVLLCFHHMFGFLFIDSIDERDKIRYSPII